MDIKKALKELKKDLEQPRPKGYQPFDKSAYGYFAYQAEQLRKRFQEQADEAKRLHDVALEKYYALKAKETTNE